VPSFFSARGTHPAGEHAGGEATAAITTGTARVTYHHLLVGARPAAGRRVFGDHEIHQDVVGVGRDR
jgi:hypothetical protein